LKESNQVRDHDFENTDENEVGLGTATFNDNSFRDQNPLLNQNNDLHDIEMGIDEGKKKTKTPSTGMSSDCMLIFIFTFKRAKLSFRSMHTRRYFSQKQYVSGQRLAHKRNQGNPG
jgi:hypothetical protein